MPVARSTWEKLANRQKLAAALLLFAAGPLCGAAALDAYAAARLRNGGYAWAGPSDAPVRIVISRSQQRAYVYSGDALIAVSTVSTGKPGHRTPLGAFTILQKAVHHRSNRYSNAPMPFMQRLTWNGIALHAGSLPGYAASHGCIRLPLAFARKLFGATVVGATVEVIDGAPSALPRVELASAEAVAPAAPAAEPAPVVPAPAVFVAAPAARLEPVVIAVAERPVRAAMPRIRLASAETVRPPHASWREQSADDFVTWGSAVGASRPPVGTQ